MPGDCRIYSWVYKIFEDLYSYYLIDFRMCFKKTDGEAYFTQDLKGLPRPKYIFETNIKEYEYY